jgi:4-amino-4-deoxy-L-arabinose transferase-like glycosyltransferase
VIDRRLATVDRFALPALLLLAAALRLPDLATRGTWDGDQGHDMLVLRTLVRDGVIPLLGPPTSIGDVHHGAWYYYLLSPAAALTGGDSPLAVVALIAIAGIAAVGVVWWLGRAVGGPVGGLVAGVLMATSAAAIDESTFIWNPNLIALSSATALAAAWRAWSGGDRRWWLVAAAGTAVTMQCHVLGLALLPILAAPIVADARRRSLGWVPIGIVAIFLAAYAPLLVNELTTGFSELEAATEYIGGGRGPVETAIPIRFGIVLLRVISWPLTGLIVDGFAAAALATIVVLAIVAWRWRASEDRERFVVRWFGLGLLWSIVFLTVAAPSLAAVVRGLPNDHYHAFADPLVFVLVGLGTAAMVREVRAPIGPVAGAALILGLIGWNLTHLPPAVHPDGGFPGGDAAGRRVDAALGGGGIDRDHAVLLRSLPDFKSTEAVVYPLSTLGRAYHGEVPRGLAPGSLSGDTYALVLLCDDLFRDANGAACGGPAEASVTPDAAAGGGAVCSIASKPRPVAGSRSTAFRASDAGIANAGAPDAGVRCPRDPDGGGLSGSCPEIR